MLIIADARFPERVFKNLEKFGEVLPFSSRGIVYECIGGHPDIFFCQTPRGLVAAPNTPAEIINNLEKPGVKLIAGTLPVGAKYPASARYNAFVGAGCLVHQQELTDPTIVENSEGLQIVDVRQGYTRCNLIEAGGLFITSDRGIETKLKDEGMETFFVDPACIKLPGQKHGFFGGCAGLHKNMLFVAGSIKHFDQGAALNDLLKMRAIELVELYDGPLWDGGSILFIENE